MWSLVRSMTSATAPSEALVSVACGCISGSTDGGMHCDFAPLTGGNSSWLGTNGMGHMSVGTVLFIIGGYGTELFNIDGYGTYCGGWPNGGGPTGA